MEKLSPILVYLSLSFCVQIVQKKLKSLELGLNFGCVV